MVVYRLKLLLISYAIYRTNDDESLMTLTIGGQLRVY